MESISSPARLSYSNSLANNSSKPSGARPQSTTALPSLKPCRINSVFPHAKRDPLVHLDGEFRQEDLLRIPQLDKSRCRCHETDRAGVLTGNSKRPARVIKTAPAIRPPREKPASRPSNRTGNLDGANQFDWFTEPTLGLTCSNPWCSRPTGLRPNMERATSP